MSQRLVTTDDHSGAEIVSADIDATQASISITRNGVALTWDGVNLTDESWGALTDLLGKFLPGITPSGQEPPEPSGQAPSGQAEALITEAASQREAAVATRQANAPRQPKAATGSKAATQAEQRARSKSIRAWWYELSQVELNRLGLPTPKDRSVQIGKMPQAVSDVYASTVEAA